MKGIPLDDDGDVVGFFKANGFQLEEIHREIWPDHMCLPGNPRCSFAMLRGPFCYPVRGGVLRTILRAAHYCEPGPIAHGEDLQ